MPIKPRSPPNITKTRGPNIGRGRRENIITAPTQKAQTQTATAQATPPPINFTSYRITNKTNNYLLFPDRKPFKNRRFTPWEWEQEKQDAKFLKRPYRSFFYDPPTYPYCVPEPIVNFDLGFH